MSGFPMCAPLALAGALLVPCALLAADKPQLSDPDFLAQAAEAGTAEIKLAELADTRASDDAVKDFARCMIKDHTAIAAKLTDAARGAKVAVVAGLDKDARAAEDRLAGLKGADFDRAYMKQMVEDHEKAVSLFEAEAKGGTTDGLKTFAADTLPTLQDHLKMARMLSDKLNK